MPTERLERIATYKLACDQFGCVTYFKATSPSMTVTFGRQCARGDGWKVTRGKPTLCPDHAPKKHKST